MALPRPLPDALVELIAERFRAIGEPTRIRMLDHLRQGEASVQDLALALGSSQQNVSKHLALLQRAGVDDEWANAAPAGVHVVNGEGEDE